MSFFRTILIAVGAGGILYGVAYYIRNKKLLANTSINATGFDIESLNLDNTRVKIYYEIKNATDFAFKVHSQSYEVTANNQKQVDIYSTEVFSVPAHGVAKSFVKASFSPKKIVKEALANIGKLGTVAINIKGHLTATSGGLLINRIPMNFNYTLKDIFPNL